VPFKSAELKDLVERAWGLGAQVSASTLASWFRHGELEGLVGWLDYYVKRLPVLRDRREGLRDQVEYARKYRDHCVERIQHWYDVGQEWRGRLDGFLKEYDELEPKVRACREAQWDPETCPKLVERFTWLRDVAIPTCEKNITEARDNELYWREEYKRMGRKIPLLETQLVNVEWELQYIESELRERWRMVL